MSDEMHTCQFPICGPPCAACTRDAERNEVARMWRQERDEARAKLAEAERTIAELVKHYQVKDAGTDRDGFVRIQWKMPLEPLSADLATAWTDALGLVGRHRARREGGDDEG